MRPGAGSGAGAHGPDRPHRPQWARGRRPGRPLRGPRRRSGCRAPATVLLGHTLDDQAETVLLGLARGSGTRSLAGMAARSRPKLLRPLLGLRRRVTAAGLRRARARGVDRPAERRPAVHPGPGPDIGAAHDRGRAGSGDRRGPGPDRRPGPRRRRPARSAGGGSADPGTDTLDCAALLELPAALRPGSSGRWLLRHGAADGPVHVGMVAALVTPGAARAGSTCPASASPGALGT